MRLQGVAVLVVGLGASGKAAARLAVAHGAVVTGVDLRTDVPSIEGVTLQLGPHDRQTFLDADLIVVSPGVSGHQADVVAAEAAGVQVIGEVALAAALLPDLPMVGITGTNGKSTVTWFVGQLLRAADLRVFVGGNLGNPLSNAVMDDETYDVAVVEVSSYQLERSGVFAPKIAV
ncbi:MAG: UDP-N-acetylmuramoylalanine--D-glutamate ligase, partial [Kiritimatiellia bacterium]